MSSLQRGALTPITYLLLTALCLFAFMPGIAALPPIDRDESRFIQATKQMVESGDYVDIRFQDVPRYKKPAGIYWLQSAAVLVSGQGSAAPVWVYRMVSVLAATLSVLMLTFIGSRMFGAAAGLIAGLGLMGILMLGFEARIAKTDAALLATALLAQGALASIYLRHKAGDAPGRSHWLFWLGHGLAILIKGPVILLLSLLTILALVLFDRDRSWLRKLHPLRGGLLMLLIAAPWLIVMTVRSGTQFWQESVGQDLLGKVATGQESHGFAPGYYALTYSAFLWPFAVMALQGGLKALQRFREDSRLLFCLAWYIPYWLAIEIIPTKLPHYALPAYPAILLLMAWSLTDAQAKAIRLASWQTWLYRASQFGAVVVCLGLAALAVAATPYLLGVFSGWGLVAALLILAAGWLGLRPIDHASALKYIACTAAVAVVAYGVLTARVLPPLKPVWLSPQIAQAFTQTKPCAGSQLSSAGYGEPSLVFLAGTGTLLTDGVGAANALLADPACAVAVVSAANQDAFLQGLGAQAHGLRELGSIQGINYSKGEPRLLTLYTLAPS